MANAPNPRYFNASYMNSSMHTAPQMSRTSRIKIILRYPGEALRYASLDPFDAEVEHESYDQLLSEISRLKPDLTILIITIRRGRGEILEITRDTYRELNNDERLSVIFQPTRRENQAG